MTQTYRTDDLARWGSGKGSDLTPTEADINFWDIIQRMIAQEARPDPSAGIDHFSITGVNLYVHMTDATVLGPYVLPTTIFRDRGVWATATAYSVNDTFSINGGLYVVVFAHTSDPTSFDPGANDGFGHDYYVLMIQTPGSAIPTGGAVGQVLEKATTSDFALQFGYKLPTGGNARQYLIKQSSTNQDGIWDDPTASDIEFVPVTGSVLTSDNVADALEELVTAAVGDASPDAVNVTFEPVTGSALTSTNVADALEEISSSTASSVGRQSIWIPAAAMTPLLTNGPAASVVEMPLHKAVIKSLDFDSSTAESAQFDIVMPKSWDSGDLFFKFFWSHASTTVNFGVTWTMVASWASDTDTLDGTVNRGPVSVNDIGGDIKEQFVSAETPASDINSPPFGSFIMFRVGRDPSDSGDNMAIDARLHGVQMFYTTNAATDD